MKNRPINNDASDARAASASANIAAAGLANSMTYLFFHPLSTAVNRMQMNEGQIDSLAQLKKIIFLQAHDQSISSKIVSMYKGSVASLNHKFLSRTIKYAGQPMIAEQFEVGFGHTARNYFGDVHGKSLIHAFAGGAIGAIDVAMLHPLSTFKTKRQGFDVRSLTQIVKAEKMASFYNGYGLAFAKTIPATFVLFGTNAGVMSYYDIKNPEEANFKHNLVAAACGVTLSAVVTNPQDVVMKRAQMMTASVSSLTLFRQTICQQGIKGLYRGFFVNVATSLPKKAVPFALYGFFLRCFQNNSIDNSDDGMKPDQVSARL